MPQIGKYSRSIRDGFVKLCRTISGAIGKFVRAVRERWSVLTVTILCFCAPVYLMAWCFDGFDNLFSRIAITVLVTILPFAKLTLPHEPLKILSLEVGISVISLMALALVVGDRYDWPFILFSVILILAALPWSLVVGETIRRERVLVAGFAPALVATMLYWFAGLAGNDEGYDLLLAPLPVVFFGGAIWAPVALLMLKFARQHKDGRITGPGMQVLTMTMLFFPVTLVAVALPKDFGLSATWSNVSLALIGIFLSGVISEPLRRMLVEWGKLSPHKD